MKDGQRIAYLWAATDNSAADYLPLHAAGRTAEIAAGLWQLRLSDGYKQQIPPLEVLADSRIHLEDRLSGKVRLNARESELPALEHLKSVAQQ
ncbi:hypothetical protein [Nocardia nova]|uniref:hypothetical protein n=1 Tax=Nocardia nova TaxID=37330 RepID=UPI0033D8CF79